MRNNGINRTVLSAYLPKTKTIFSCILNERSTLFFLSSARDVSTQPWRDNRQDEFTREQKVRWDPFHLGKDCLTRQQSLGRGRMKQADVFESPYTSLLELVWAKKASSDIVELNGISFATFTIDLMWRKLHMVFTGFVFASTSISFVCMDVFIYHLHLNHVTSRKARRISENDHNWAVRKCFHFIVSSWQIKSRKRVSYWSRQCRMRNRLFWRSISKADCLVLNNRCLIVSRIESCRSSHGKTKTNIFVPDEMSFEWENEWSSTLTSSGKDISLCFISGVARLWSRVSRSRCSSSSLV